MGYKLTKQQLKDKMELLREVFDVVRIVDGNGMQGLADENGENYCACYEFWNRNSKCKNCVSKVALEQKTQKTKLEYLNERIYQVIARYIEVDGKPCVMEMVKKLDEDSLIDTIGSEILIDKLSGYTDKKFYEDVLTGAYNRRFFEEKIKPESYSGSLALIDLDDFKLYNDTYGHAVGDEVLVASVKAIQKGADKDDIVVRYGGDEFLLIMPSTGENELESKLQTVRSEINSAKVKGAENVRISASIGAVTVEDEAIENVVNQADRMMYVAKNYKNMVATEKNILEDESYAEMAKEKGNHKPLILIVDDSEINRGILKAILGKDFKVLQASNGRECMDILNQFGTGIALVLLDIVMPEMDGFAVLESMQKRNMLEEIPVVMISVSDDESIIKRVYDMGVADYISKPFDARVVYRRVYNLAKLYSKQRRLVGLLNEHIKDKEKNNRMLITILSQIVEFRNKNGGMHISHISGITDILLERLMLDTDKYSLTWYDRYIISSASALHDIGSIGVDEKILNKNGALTTEEFEAVKKHTVIGAELLKNIKHYQNEKIMKAAVDICKNHHERYDGKGYPNGLIGDDIPISAQVVSLADVYDALTSDRPFRKAYSHNEAVSMILNGECGAFNPVLIECFKKVEDDIRKFVEENNE